MTVYLTDFKTFETKAELNEAVNGHLTYQDLNETDRDVLIMLSQYSVKYYGVSHLKAKTIADHIGKSERTVRRVTKKLEQLGIIRKLKTFRKISGGKGANIMQILPFNKEDFLNDMTELSHCEEQYEVVSEPIVTTSKQVSNKSEPITNKTSNSIITDETVNGISDDRTLDKVKEDKLKKSLLNSIPKGIAKTLGIFFNDVKDIYEIYGTILKAKSNALFNTRIEEHEQEFEKTLVNVVRRWKLGKVQNLQGYVYKSFHALSTSLGIKETANDIFGF